MINVNALIAGSTGYIGLQLVKLLLNHKNVKIKYLCGNSSQGKKISFFDKDLKNKKLPKIIKFNKKLLSHVDVVFTALPNGETQNLSKLLLKKNVLIDLSADFRLKNPRNYLKWYKLKHKAKENIRKSIYALPEISKNQIKKYNIISCPGCYPTSILLPLIPLIKKNKIFVNNIVIDSKSGYSGGGRGIHKKYIKKNLYESLSAYGVGFHRHNSEIQQELNIYSKTKVNFSFTPHLSPMFRGILSTIYLDIKKNENPIKILNLLKNYYNKEKFIKIVKLNELVSTNDVINTNYCNISICRTKFKNKIIILSAIDNLIKGGAGQAIQNLNIKYGFNKIRGLV
tara:strand:+ start:60 stop:1082 length:1023 start_codon:yes stop_codon:yes gene_type:complete